MRIVLTALIAGGLFAATAATSFAEPEKDRSERGKRGEEFRARMLEKFDADGDGKLSDEEKAEARKAFEARRGEGRPGAEGRRGPQDRPSREEFRKRMLEQFDKDGDGELNEDERKAAHEAMQARMKERREAMLKKFDKDGDGELNEEERAALRKEFGGRRGGPPGARDRGPRGEGEGARSRGPRERDGERRGGGPEGRRGPRGEKDQPL